MRHMETDNRNEKTFVIQVRNYFSGPTIDAPLSFSLVVEITIQVFLKRCGCCCICPSVKRCYLLISFDNLEKLLLIQFYRRSDRSEHKSLPSSLYLVKCNNKQQKSHEIYFAYARSLTLKSVPTIRVPIKCCEYCGCCRINIQLIFCI